MISRLLAALRGKDPAPIVQAEKIEATPDPGLKERLDVLIVLVTELLAMKRTEFQRSSLDHYHR